MDEVGNALLKVGVEAMTITEVKGFGRQRGHTQIYRGSEYSMDFVPKVKIEVTLADGQADAVVAALIKGARTGKIGDGKIFVSSITQAARM